MHPYRNFILMIAVSATLMFGLMYLNTYQLGHVWFSQTRLFMTFIMAGSMALVMLFFMRHMYKDKQANVAIVIGSVALMGLGFWLVRSQATVGDVAWMKAMIPHHSIAILTSERANITDPRVRKLADDIIEAQRREIGEMEVLIRDIDDQSAETSHQPRLTLHSSQRRFTARLNSGVRRLCLRINTFQQRYYLDMRIGDSRACEQGEAGNVD
jgi:hypothetical protein